MGVHLASNNGGAIQCVSALRRVSYPTHIRFVKRRRAKYCRIYPTLDDGPQKTDSVFVFCV